MAERLNLGCGNDILAGWVNHDLAPLKGVDVVHDLTSVPWPFDADQFDEIRVLHVLEHMDDLRAVMEELHRIARDGARLTVRVPYWNSPDMISDPTHRRFFNESTFDFFDPASPRCQERPYYSTARFSVSSIAVFVRARGYRRIETPLLRSAISLLARYLGGVIWVVEFELVCVKGATAASQP